MFPQLYYFLPLYYIDIEFSLIKASILQLCVSFLLKLCKVLSKQRRKKAPHSSDDDLFHFCAASRIKFASALNALPI